MNSPSDHRPWTTGHRALVIGICGGTGSGKTTIANRIIQAPAANAADNKNELKVLS